MLNRDNDALNEEQLFNSIISLMIEEDKTFRDPVHDDILVNHLETRIIDTESYQRLRKIRQLGTVHLDYHGAEHSRFQHSLGVLYMTSLIIDKVKRNRFSPITKFSSNTDDDKASKQDNGFVLITRLAALMHDLTVIPFSHTLEKEGNLFPAQWDDNNMTELLIGSSSEIYRKIVNYTKLLMRENFKIDDQKCEEYAKHLTNTILTYVLMVIKFPDNTQVKEHCKKLYGSHIWTDLMDAEFIPVAAQMVLNTICADLLDYLKRDFYFCGIKKTYDDRFLKYACVVKQDKLPVFAYRLTNKKRELKSSVLSSLLNTLELRFDLAELVHTHDAKNCFSAMVIEAFNFYWQSLSGPQREALLNDMLLLGDDELLAYLNNKGGEVTRKLVKFYNSRTAYKRIVLFRGWAQAQDNKRVIDLFQNPRKRYELEKRIATWINDKRLKEGDCLIYVMPNPEKLYKALEAYTVYYSDHQSQQAKIERLEKIASFIQQYNVSSEERITAEIIDNRIKVLRTNYANIWKTYVFVAENAIELKDEIIGVIDKILDTLGIPMMTPERSALPANILAKIEKIASSPARLFTTIEDLPEKLPEI